MGKRIIAVFGDIGGCKETVPALALLKERGHAIDIVIDGGPLAKALTVLPDSLGPTMTGRMPVVTDAPDAIVIGTSATAAFAQNSWTDFGRSRGIPVVWVEDLYGTGEREIVRASGGPDVLCVIDDAAAGIARAVWPKAAIAICGKPTFARLNAMIADQPKIRRTVRDRLALKEGEKLLTFFSGGQSPADELRAVDGMYALRETRGLRMAMRLHPKLATADRVSIEGRFALWPAGVLTDSEPTYKTDAEELTLASDVMVCSWGSTQGYAAVLARVATVVLMFGPREERAALGYPDGLPPHVAHCAALPAFSGADVTRIVKDVLLGRAKGAHMVSAANLPFRPLIAPGAAERIADAILIAMG